MENPEHWTFIELVFPEVAVIHFCVFVPLFAAFLSGLFFFRLYFYAFHRKKLTILL